MPEYIPQVVQAVALDDFKIKVYFHDGHIRIFDMKPLLDCGEVFEPLKDPVFFRERLTVLNKTAAWDIAGNYDPTKCVDIDPETIYFDGIKVVE